MEIEKHTINKVFQLLYKCQGYILKLPCSLFLSCTVNGESHLPSPGRTGEHTLSAAPSTDSIHSTQANGQSSDEPLGEVRRLTAALSVQSSQSEPALHTASQATESTELLLALSRQTIHHDSELRSRERVCEDLERRMASELDKKNKQIEELTTIVESQQILLRELADKLGIHVNGIQNTSHSH